MILLAVWAIAPVELPLTVAIAKTADVVKQCFEKITASPSREVNWSRLGEPSYFLKAPTLRSKLTILHRDQSLVAIDKPAGLMVHRSRIDVHARQFALQMLRDQIGQPVFPIHRLDRPTSGVLLFALNRDIARALNQQFETRTIKKSYTAIVRGIPPKRGISNEPLLEKPDPIVDALARKDKPPQPAVTHFETMTSWEVPFSTGKYPHSRYSLVNISPKTGRRHQIRRHFNHMAYPIIGDTSHGDRRHNRLFRDQFNNQRLLLVASSMTLSHPETQTRLTIKADLGLEFKEAITQLDLHSIDKKLQS